MTALENRPGTEACPPPGLGIGRLLGRGCFDVVTAPGGLDREVRGVTIWDPAVPDAVEAGDVVLVPAPDLPPALVDQVLTAASDADAAAVVVKAPGDPATLRRRADRLGVTVLVAAAEVPWDDIATLARSLAPADRLSRAIGRPAVLDLYELAEAAAYLLEGPISITDEELRPLAFANLGHPVDQLRTSAILARRTPSDARTWLEDSGQWARLRSGRTPMRIDIPGAAPRALCPVVARDAIVGYICLAAGGAPHWEPDLDALADVAAAAAPFFSAPLRGVDADLLAADLLRSVLRGTASLSALAAELLPGPGQDSWCLIALGASGCGSGSPVGSANGTYEDDRQLAAYARLLRRGSAAAVLDGRVYLLTPHWGSEDVVALAERMRQRAGSLFSATFSACVSDALTGDVEIPGIRRSLDRAVDLLASQSRPRTALLAEVRPNTVLAELGEIVKGNPGLLDGVLDVLQTGSARDTDYLRTLRAYFDAGCDVSEAAKRLQIHRNTLRYRLHRIEALCEVDLSDPQQRFLVELHTRLLPIT
ncbi:PucR family transcriptional regulator [Sporichthya polymorpha]|uniref:PucR family transcriptional regulator n=1 Tax=Sporichthya polymorpha TaxID=35751 RepID=UPI000373E742|nr:helix-turn-helix domain-containing protein [Sporichthya polymorpha]